MSKRVDEAELSLLEDGRQASHLGGRSQTSSPASAYLSNPRVRLALIGTVVLTLVYLVFHGSARPYDADKIPFATNATEELASLSRLKTSDLMYQRSFSSNECSHLFKDLYYESERAKAFWKDRGGISQELVQQSEGLSSARVIIKDNQMYVRYFNNGLFSRAYAQLAIINEAVITAREPLPDVDFTMAINDWPHAEMLPMWELTRENRSGTEQSWIMPDYGFYSWPEPGVGSFVEVMRKTQEKERKLGSWAAKDKKLFWKGAFWVNPLRERLFRKLEGRPWADIQDMNWGDDPAAHKKNIDDHCQFKYLAHVEGGSSSGRLKFIQMCRSVIVMHELHYIQHFHHLMNSDPNDPMQNTVVVKGEEWNGIEGIMEDLLRDEAKAERIASNSYNFWRYWNSPAATSCYIRKMIFDWAEVQTFKPEVRYDDASYASFDLMRQPKWDIH